MCLVPSNHPVGACLGRGPEARGVAWAMGGGRPSIRRGGVYKNFSRVCCRPKFSTLARVPARPWLPHDNFPLGGGGRTHPNPFPTAPTPPLMVDPEPSPPLSPSEPGRTARRWMSGCTRPRPGSFSIPSFFCIYFAITIFFLPTPRNCSGGTLPRLSG